jgi:hypothetical protein
MSKSGLNVQFTSDSFLGSTDLLKTLKFPTASNSISESFTPLTGQKVIFGALENLDFPYK